MEIKIKTALVAGGAGFIGSNVVNALIKGGVQVSIIDNLVTGKKENLNPAAAFYEMNIADDAVERIFEKERPEVLYHFAFNVLVPKSVENPLMDMDSIVGSVKLLMNAKKYGVKKIIFASSGFIYGNSPRMPVKETELPDLVSPYAIAKYTVENYLKFFKKTYNLPYVVFRKAAVYGPGQVTGAMADYIRKLKAGDQADIWGDGNKTRDYVYIDDVVDAYLKAIDLSDNFEDPVFNIGSGKETTLNDLYKKIAGLLGKEAKPNYHPDRPGEQIRYCLDNSKIKQAIGWQPKVHLEDGLKRILEFQDAKK